MDYRNTYNSWLNDSFVDEATKDELRKIAEDEREIEDRFYKDLEFGTGGLRGVLGAGSNRLNIYTIRKATQGLANYIKAQPGYNGGAAVAIAHDCRRMSPEFSKEAALVLNGNGIKTYVFDSLRPTPVLSFAVRYLSCTAGIVITASHNPPEYNGYKVYWSDGGQTPYPRDEEIIAQVNEVTDFSLIKTITHEEAVAKGLYNMAPPSLDDVYIENVTAQLQHPDIAAESDIKIVYTPLHGSGNVPVRRALANAGFKNVFIVPEQEMPDGGFPTVSYPNPEDAKAFVMALKLAAQHDADIVVATDPDADRVGAAVRHKGEYKLLTGNMTGVILAEYILSSLKEKGSLPANGALISTIVSTDMTKAIAKAYGIAYFDVLTGFKYIGEKIKEFEQTGEHSYVFGFEESYGCLAGTYARDKDAVVASLLICEAAAFYKKQGLTLLDALDNLYAKYGYYIEAIESITLKGLEGLADMRRIMAQLRDNPPISLAGVNVTEARDYLNKTIVYPLEGRREATTLPVSDVLYYALEDGSWVCVRPSGTEPKIKIYFGALSADKLTGLKTAMKEVIT